MKHRKIPFALRAVTLAAAMLGAAGLFLQGALAQKLLAAAVLLLLAALAWGCSEAVRLLQLACAAPVAADPPEDADEIPTL